MHPELVHLPLIGLSIKSYGFMLVVGFLVATALMRRLAKGADLNPDTMSNLALYALIAGVVGARFFYVVHHHQQFQNNWLAVFAVWQGGLELLGGVFVAGAVVAILIFYQRLPAGQYLDILAIGVMVGLGFGRIGCFLNGCCWGKPSQLPWAVRFPYGSFAYQDQAFPNPARNRTTPYLILPPTFYGFPDGQGGWRDADQTNWQNAYLKPLDALTDQQRECVLHGPCQCKPVHPTQLYDSANGFIAAATLYAVWRRWHNRLPGLVCCAAMVWYGITRFGLEFLRDDNPFEYGWWALYRGGTISQNLGIYMAIVGILLAAWIVLRRRHDKKSRTS